MTRYEYADQYPIRRAICHKFISIPPICVRIRLGKIAYTTVDSMVGKPSMRTLPGAKKKQRTQDRSNGVNAERKARMERFTNGEEQDEPRNLANKQTNKQKDVVRLFFVRVQFCDYGGEN